MSLQENRVTRASEPVADDASHSESSVSSAIDALQGTLDPTLEAFGLRQPPPQDDETTHQKHNAYLHGISSGVNALAMAQSMPSQLLNTGLAEVPLLDKMPGMPAAVIGAAHLGTPHAHDHPPSAGFPLPSVGATIGSGCLSVLIGGIPAARVLDIGIAPTCGGLTPLFDITTGSSNTFIGGMRAARMGIDQTRHCNPMGPVGKEGGEAEQAAKEGEQVASEAEQVTGRARVLGGAGKAWKVGNAALGPASGAASSADQATSGDGAAATMTAAQTAADLATMALANLMGKDPGIEPSIGMLMDGNPTVLIGGFPMPDSQMMWHGIKHGLGKKVRPKLPQWAQELACEFFGEPVSAVTGEVKNDFTDYETDEVVPFKWGRHYCSGWHERDGVLGYGFRHSWQHELQLLRTRAIYTDPRGTEYVFNRRADGTYGGCCQGYEIEQLDGQRFIVRHDVQGDLEFERFSATDRSPRCVGHVRQGRRSRLRWDTRGCLGKIEQADDSAHIRRIAQFHYDEHKRIVEVAVTDVDGQINRIARYGYDTNGCLVSCRNALDAVSASEYEVQRRLARLTDANGYSFCYRYNGEGRCVESSGEDGLWHVQFQYHPGRTIVTEGDGGRWTVAYSDAGTITRVIDPYGGVTEYSLGADGRIVEEIDSGGRALRWLYDTRDRNIGRLDRFGNVWPGKDELPNLPNPLAHNVPNAMLGLMWGNANDADFADTVLLPPEIDHGPLGSATAASRSPHKQRQQCDAAGRVIRRTDISGHTERFEYDAEDNLLRWFDQDGVATRYTRCSWNLLASEENALGATIRYRYAPRREVASITDANGNETAYGYDLKNRVTSVTRHGRLRESYLYDGGDRLIEKRDGTGGWLLKFEIGENGLPRERTLASGGRHVYEYDRFGRHTKASTDAHEITRTFDQLGRRTSDKRNGVGVEHAYDGRRLRRTTYFERFEVMYTPTAPGVTSIRTPGGGTHCIQRGKDGRVLLQVGNGTQVCYMFDDIGRCTERVTWRIDTPAAFRRVTYEYSGAGELSRVGDSANGETHYQYDGVHRLIGEVRNGWQSRVYEYDPAGNLLSMPGCSRMRYADGNRLSTTSHGQYRYNERNHLSEEIARDGRRTTYRYDSMDLLVGVEWSDRPDAWMAEYDGLCRQMSSKTGDLSTEYYWDEDRLAAQIEPSGKLRIFVYVDTTSLVPFMFIDYPDVDAPETSGTEYFVLCNQVGMPERIEGGAGDAVWLAKEIDPYGTIVVAEGNSVEYDLRWPGHWLQRETGLHVNRFRSYSPMLGRYLQSDPLGLAGGINLYAYASNPLTVVDVLGLQAHNQNAQSNEPVAENPEVAGTPRELTPSEARRAAQLANNKAGLAAKQKAFNDLSGKIWKLWQKNEDLSGEDQGVYQELRKAQDDQQALKKTIENWPPLHTRESEFTDSYSVQTHIEMIKRYTNEGQKWVREGDTTQFPVDPIKNPEGLIDQRHKLHWVDHTGERISFYKTNDDGTSALDKKGNKITNVTYDHQISEAEMWNEGATVERRRPFPKGPVVETKVYPPGKDTDRDTRNAFHNDFDNLVVMGRGPNAEKGSRASGPDDDRRHRFTQITGPNYRV